MEHSQKALALALALALSACGGGGGGDDSPDQEPIPVPSPDPEPPENSSPVASADFGTTVNNQNVSIDVLGNDSDDDDDPLTLEEITSQPEHGSVAIDGDMVVYTPDVGYYGQDTFSYRVSDGDTSSEGMATITVGQEVVVQGVVADSQSGEVTVSADLGDKVASTTTDSDGNYELTFVIEQQNDFISLTSEQQVGGTDLKLASALGSSDMLVDAASSQSGRRVTDSSLSKAKISYLTTAMWLFYEHQRGGSDANVDEFEDYVATLSVDQLVDAASFIKVMATSSEYNIDDDADTLSFFTRSDDSVEDTIFNYLSDRDAVDQSGELSADYLAALNAARSEMIANGRLSKPVVDSELAGNVWAQVRVRGNFSAETDKALTFDEQGRGKETGLWSDWQATRIENIAFSWTLNNGTVSIEYDDNVNGVAFSCAGDPRLSIFSQEAQDAAEFYCSVTGASVLPVRVRKDSLTLNKVSEVDGVSHFQSQATHEYTLALTSVGGEKDFTAEQSELDVRSYATTPEPLSLEASTITDTRWSFTVPSTIEYTIPAPDGDQLVRFSGYFPDIINFRESETFTSDNTGENGTWSMMDDGTLALEFNGQSVSVLPFMETDFSMLALVTVDSGDDTFTVVSEMVPEDKASLDESFKLVLELPEIWSSLSHCPVEGCWTYGKLKASKFAGFSFDDDNTMAWLNAASDNESFERASQGSTAIWQRDPGSNVIEVITEGQDAEGNTYLEYRSWELLQISEEGWLKVIELYAVHLYYADDSEDPEEYIYKPHIETLRKTDLSEEFPGMWEATMEQGVL